MGETVEISREEYQRLLRNSEELDALRVFDSGKAALSKGEDELIPAAYAKRLVNGESPLRVYRQLRGLTQVDLAKSSGVNRVVISEIETGTAKGSIHTAIRLAEALGISIDDLY